MAFEILTTGLPEGLPDKTLGWQVLEWCTRYLVNPDDKASGRGKPWIFQPDQARFVLWFYAVDDEGDWIYRRAYRERAKGTGKSPMVAAIACAELLGPVVFDGWNEDGTPRGRENQDSYVQLAAVSLDQCKNTFGLIMNMLEKAAEEYDLDVGMTRILVRGQSNRRIDMITASPRSQEGFRPSFVIMEETQNWIPAEQGPEFARTLRRNLAKTDSRSIEVTNAPVPGEASVAEDTHKFYNKILEGDADDEGLLFDSYVILVENIFDEEQAIPALKEMYKHAPWINIKRIWGEINDPSVREVDSRRFYFNEMCSTLAMWISKDNWESAAKEQKLFKDDKISLGFRGKRACVSLVAVRLIDGATFLLKNWEAPQGAKKTWETDYLKVDSKVRSIMKSHNVVSIYADHRGYQDIVGRWAIDHDEDSDNPVEVKEFLTSNKGKMALAIEQFETAVYDKRLTHDNDPDLTRHVLNCFTDEIPQGLAIRQETPYSQRYIVAAEAAVLAYEAAQAAIEDGALRDEPQHFVYSY